MLSWESVLARHTPAPVCFPSWPDANGGDLTGSTSNHTEKPGTPARAMPPWAGVKPQKWEHRASLPCLFNDPSDPGGQTYLVAAEEEQVPGLVGEELAGVAGDRPTCLQQGVKEDHAPPGQRDARKWLEVGTAKEVSWLMRKPGSQRGVGGGADQGGRTAMGKIGLDGKQ